MTDDYTPTPDEAIAEAARALDLKPEPIPGSEDLPDDVRDGVVEETEGGPLTPNGPYTIAGPEWFVPSVSGQIVAGNTAVGAGQLEQPVIEEREP